MPEQSAPLDAYSDPLVAAISDDVNNRHGPYVERSEIAAVVAAFRRLPVEQRMEAMGMVAYGTVEWDDDEERDVVVPPDDVDVLPGAPVFVDGSFVGA